MRDMEILAKQAECKEMSLIVNSANKITNQLHSKNGFTSRDQLPTIYYPGGQKNSRWMLMVKAI